MYLEKGVLKMKIVKVTFTDWNCVEHQVDVTSDMCEKLGWDEHEENMICTAIQYIKRRYTECSSIDAVEIVAR